CPLDDQHERIESGLRAVGPPRPRLKLQRDLTEPRYVVGVRFFSLQGNFRVFAIAYRPADQTGSVRQEIFDRDLTLRWNGVETRRRAALSGWSGRRLSALQNSDFEVLEFRNELRDRIVKADLSFFDHHQHGDAYNRLRHGHDSKH